MMFYRGEQFRREFSHLSEIRSIIPESVNGYSYYTNSARKFVVKSLSMQVPQVIYVPPAKDKYNSIISVFLFLRRN